MRAAVILLVFVVVLTGAGCAARTSVSAPVAEWRLPEPTSALRASWDDAPSVPEYARTYVYIPGLIETADPFLVAVSSAGNLDPAMVWMLKVVVSATNECHYCLSQAVVMANHSGYSQDDVFAVQTNIEASGLVEKDKALLRLAHTLTTAPTAVGPVIESARTAGWTDAQIAQAIHVAAAWNYTNRFANAFELERDWLHPYDEGARVPIRTAGTDAERQFLIDSLTGAGE